MVIDGSVSIIEKIGAAAMTSDELRETLRRFDISQAGFARAIGVSNRMVRYWIAGKYPIPRRTIAVIEIMAELNEMRTVEKNFAETNT
jgi:DNA-binding transcriptional regulator YiaG